MDDEGREEAKDSTERDEGEREDYQVENGEVFEFCSHSFIVIELRVSMPVVFLPTVFSEWEHYIGITFFIRLPGFLMGTRHRLIFNDLVSIVIVNDSFVRYCGLSWRRNE